MTAHSGGPRGLRGNFNGSSIGNGTHEPAVNRMAQHIAAREHRDRSRHKKRGGHGVKVAKQADESAFVGDPNQFNGA